MGYHDLSSELPTSHADLDPHYEGTWIRIKGSVWPVKGEVEANVRGHSPSSAAVAVLMLAAGAGLAGVLVGGAGRLMRVPPVLAGISVLTVFLVVFGTGAWLMLLRGYAAPGQRVTELPAAPPGQGQVTGHPGNGHAAGGGPADGYLPGSGTAGHAHHHPWRARFSRAFPLALPGGEPFRAEARERSRPGEPAA